MKLNQSEILWCGLSGTFDFVLEAQDALARLELQGVDALKAKFIELRGGMMSDNPFEMPPLYTVKDGVAVLSIAGPLVTGSSGFMRLFGVLGYDDIRKAAIDAVSQKSVKSLLLHVSSGGGAAAGVEDCNACLRELGTVKPITTYTDTVMGSAAYWIGASGSHIGAAKTATLGSVGVIAVHMEMSKAHEQAGRKYTVIRAGEYKQLANPVEPLSDAGKEEIKAQAEQTYDVFADGVSAARGVDRKKFDATMGRGREFLGLAAVDVGLADSIMSFDEAFAYAKSVDSSKLNNQNSRTVKKDSAMNLATAIILSLMGGADYKTLDLSKAEATAEGVVPDAAGASLLQAQAIQISAARDAAISTAVKAAVDPVTLELNTLKGTHATVNTELAGLRTSSAAVTEKCAKLETDLAAADNILKASIGAMCVALSATDTSKDLTGPALLAEHKRLETAFAAKYPAGRVSAVTTLTADDGGGNKPVTPETIPAFARIARNLQPTA